MNHARQTWEQPAVKIWCHAKNAGESMMMSNTAQGIKRSIHLWGYNNIRGVGM